MTNIFRNIEQSKRIVTGLFDVPLTRTAGVVVALIALDLLWWTMMYTGRVPMPGMPWLMTREIPMIAPGAMELATLEIGGLRSVAGYLAMWGVMMWAMMYPAMTRFTRDYAAAHRGSSAAAGVAVAAFLASYSVVWALSGVVPLAVHWLLPGGIYGVTQAYPHLVVGGVLVLTGLYQLSSFKQRRLQICCSHVGPHEEGVLGALRRGANHGGTCILVCFGLFFLLMPFFGSMNFLWMVALATVAIVERIPARWGREVAAGTGVVALLAGLIVLFVQPPLPLTFGM